MIYIPLTKIKVPLIPGSIHWNLAWIMESHRILSCHWSNYCFETHHGQESSERGLLISQASACFSMNFPVLFPIRFRVSWTLEAFRSLSGERDRLGSKDGMGMDGMGMGGKDADFAWKKFASKICPIEWTSLKDGCTDFFTGFKWPNSERPSGNAEFCQAHGVWRP